MLQLSLLRWMVWARKDEDWDFVEMRCIFSSLVKSSKWYFPFFIHSHSIARLPLGMDWIELMQFFLNKKKLWNAAHSSLLYIPHQHRSFYWLNISHHSRRINLVWFCGRSSMWWWNENRFSSIYQRSLILFSSSSKVAMSAAAANYRLIEIN